MKSVLERFVERPVLAAVISLVILLLGLQALNSLIVRQYPETTDSTITVATPYFGANAELVRGFITTPLEQAIATAEGVDYLESSSTQGQSLITARLELDYNPNEAVAEVLAKVSQVSNQLPPQAENSIITVTTGSQQAAMYLAFFSEALDPAEITDYLTRAVRPRLETISGIESASVQGASTLALRIWLDPDRMAAANVTPGEVRQAIVRSNVLAAVGDTKGATLAIPLVADTSIEDVEGFRNLTVRASGDTIIRLKDVADVLLGSENYGASVFFDGAPVVFLAITITPTANLLDAVQGVRELLPEIERQLPGGLSGTVVYDSTIAVDSSINEVINALVEALLIVTFIIALFLGAVRSTLVPGVAMPLAIIGSFFIMQMLGYSINLLTLLALILAIGTVVDDGIVIVENATRHIENGATADEAAKRTVRELASSIVAMNIVVLAVFAPIGLMGGLTGSLFTEFAYTVAGATLISGIIALTLSPMMCAKLLNKRVTKKGLAKWVDTGFRKTASGYGRALALALDGKWIIIGLGGIILVSNFFLFRTATSELAPTEDDGFLIVQATADPNISIDQLERWTSDMTAAILSFDSVKHVFAVNGIGLGGSVNNSAFGGVVLDDWSDRDITTQELQPQVQQAVGRIAGIDTVVIPPPPLPGVGGGAPVQYVLSSIQAPREVLAQAQQIQAAAMQSGIFAYIESDLKFDKVQYRVEVDRDRAAAIGLDIDRLGDDLATMLSGGYINFFSLDGRSYRVVPQVDRKFRLQPEQLQDYYLRTRSGALVPAATVISLEREVVPRSLSRFNQLNAAVLTGVPAPGVALGEAVAFLQEQSDALPEGYVVDWAGQSRQFVSESESLLLTIALAITLMYLTLAAQYNSFRDPAIMLLSVPMAVAGALLFAALGVITINIYTQIGLLALIGSIVRHGILLVEFANGIQVEQGLDRRAAMEKAGQLRLRAILMTTIATLVGLIPLLIASSGPGAESRFAISFTLGVGMAIGTLFTLFVVPALYVVIAGKHGERSRLAEVSSSRNSEDQSELPPA